MAIKPGGIGNRKASNKNPPILSHEFIIQNHADIVSCIAMLFVVGIMLQATNSIASIFVSLHHNVTGADPSQENPRGIPFFYDAGLKDLCAVFFYTLICIIMHAILQEYLLDKVSKKLHLSKYKLSRFNESGQLVVFYVLSFFWGLEVIYREQYFGNITKLWADFPNHPMGFLHKLFFIVQLSYYIHMLPELYFQKIKREEQEPKIKHAICGFTLIGTAYALGLQRVSLVFLTLHYFSEAISHTFQLVDIFDKDEKMIKLRIIKNVIFVGTRFTTMVLSVLTLYFGIGSTEEATRGLFGLFIVFALQGFLIFGFITDLLRNKRETDEQLQEKLSNKKNNKNSNSVKTEKTKKDRKKESDLPEADQNTATSSSSSISSSSVNNNNNNFNSTPVTAQKNSKTKQKVK